jgi:hypothetical protein
MALELWLLGSILLWIFSAGLAGALAFRTTREPFVIPLMVAVVIISPVMGDAIVLGQIFVLVLALFYGVAPYTCRMPFPSPAHDRQGRPSNYNGATRPSITRSALAATGSPKGRGSALCARRATSGLPRPATCLRALIAPVAGVVRSRHHQCDLRRGHALVCDRLSATHASRHSQQWVVGCPFSGESGV